MSKLLEQRSYIKFYFINGINALKTLKMTQKLFGDESLSRARFLMDIAYLKKVENLLKIISFRTSINIKQIKEEVMENRHLTVKTLAEYFGISHGSVKTILSDIPKLLNFLQKQVRLTWQNK